jgi:hypothetical protein
MVSLITEDTPALFLTLKYTLFVPLPLLRMKEGAVAYVLQTAPLKVEDPLAMYCVGLPVAVLFSVTVRLVVVLAPLLILNDVMDGLVGTLSVTVSLTTGETPALFLTLK